jgi:aspartate/methionine/tyrosine aminotransferase
MTRVATKDGALNLAQGFPDFDPPKELLEAAKKAIDDGHNQYAVTFGSPTLRKAIAAKVEKDNKIPCNADDNVVVTCGATEAMMAAMLAVCNTGEEVIQFEPYYENYGPDSIISGAKPRYVRLSVPDFDFDDEDLKAAINKKTKAIIINTPGNPTGRIIPKDRLKVIMDLVKDHDLLAITDEIYEKLIYDGLEHTSPASLPGMADHTISIFGFSKTYSVTGWRLGYTVAPKTLTDGIKRVHDFLTVGAPAPLQEAAVTALKMPASYYDQQRKEMTERRDIILQGLQAAGFKVFKPNSAYYVLADFTAVAPGMDDHQFARWLSREVKVACVPGSSFFRNPKDGQNLVRFAFPTLREAAKRLATVREKITSARIPA